MTTEQTDWLAEIRSAESHLRAAQHAYLRSTGWLHTSDTPGYVWRWVKTLADGRVVMADMVGAVSIQKALK